VVGDAKLQAEGKADQAGGKLQSAVGGLKNAIRKIWGRFRKSRDSAAPGTWVVACSGVGATLDGGVLQVDLERELPEAMKPRRIAVESKPGSSAKMIEGKKAA
jgi:hypothetical protein